MNKETHLFIYKSFGETLDFAESLGWQDNEEEWNCEIAEALEYDALDFIKKKGFKIVQNE